MKTGRQISARFGMRHRRFVRNMRRKLRHVPMRRRILAFFVTVLTVAGLIWLNGKTTPVLFELAESGAQGMLNACLEQVMREISAEDILHTVTGADGRVLSVSVDADRMNRYQASAARLLQRALESRGVYRMRIPLGTLTGVGILSGRGPRVSVRISPTGSVSAEAKSSFTSAGINQTCHRIDLYIFADITVFLPNGKSKSVRLSSALCAAETVIVGNVPARMYPS